MREKLIEANVFLVHCVLTITARQFSACFLQSLTDSDADVLQVLCEWKWLVGRLRVSLTSELISNYTQGRVARDIKSVAGKDVFSKRSAFSITAKRHI